MNGKKFVIILTIVLLIIGACSLYAMKYIS